VSHEGGGADEGWDRDQAPAGAPGATAVGAAGSARGLGTGASAPNWAAHAWAIGQAPPPGLAIARLDRLLSGESDCISFGAVII